MFKQLSKILVPFGLMFSGLFFSEIAVAGEGLSGMWHGIYTSSHSPQPTQELFIFGAYAGEHQGVYLSESGSAGTFSGVAQGGVMSFVVMQPVKGCRAPTLGTLTFQQVDADTYEYFFHGTSCKGSDTGQGVAKRGGEPVTGWNGKLSFWNGRYQSSYSPEGKEVFIFSQKEDSQDVTGVYLSDSGAAGVLTGQWSENGAPFLLQDNAPAINCPAASAFVGQFTNGTSTEFRYEFNSQNCVGSVDRGIGTATLLSD